MTGIQQIGLNIPLYASHHMGFTLFTFGSSFIIRRLFRLTTIQPGKHNNQLNKHWI